MEIKIGTRVEVVEHSLLAFLVGHTGAVVKEKIPESQWAMLSGRTNWTIKFDEPIAIMGETIQEATLREDSLAVI